MYTTIIHPIRKSLNLSCNEYIILDTIYQLSHNIKYGGWCIASKDKLALWLDLDRKTVFRGINTLISKELIIKDDSTKYLKTTDSYNEMIANKNDWIIAFKGKETAFISGKTEVPYQIGTDSPKMPLVPSQNATIDSPKMPLVPYNTNNNNNITRARDFLLFWTAYQLRKSKDAAWRAFMKVDVPVEVLLAAIEAQEKERKDLTDRGEFVANRKYPATWLNHRCWEDEAAPMPEKGDDFYINEMRKLGPHKFVRKYDVATTNKYLNQYMNE